jgi:hypothetical protein
VSGRRVKAARRFLVANRVHLVDGLTGGAMTAGTYEQLSDRLGVSVRWLRRRTKVVRRMKESVARR